MILSIKQKLSGTSPNTAQAVLFGNIHSYLRDALNLCKDNKMSEKEAL